MHNTCLGRCAPQLRAIFRSLTTTTTTTTSEYRAILVFAATRSPGISWHGRAEGLYRRQHRSSCHHTQLYGSSCNSLLLRAKVAQLSGTARACAAARAQIEMCKPMFLNFLVDVTPV